MKFGVTPGGGWFLSRQEVKRQQYAEKNEKDVLKFENTSKILW